MVKKILLVILSVLEVIGMGAVSYVSLVLYLWTRQSLFEFIKNDETYYLIWVYVSFIVLWLLAVFAYRKVTILIRRKSWKIGLALRIITVVLLFPVVLYAMLVLVMGGISYDYCGKEFNQEYLNAVRSNNPNFCLDENVYKGIIGSATSKGSVFCHTSTERGFELHYNPVVENRYDKLELDLEHVKASCISAMARDLDDLAICDMIAEHNLIYSQGQFSIPTAGDSRGCIYDYAVYKHDKELCSSVAQTMYQCD